MTVATMVRHNEGKPQFSFLPNSFMRAMLKSNNIGNPDAPAMLEGITRVLEFGAKKYSADNWRVGGSWRKVCDSALRHLIWMTQGEVIDAESGLPHIAHFGCNLVFLLEFEDVRSGADDRYKRPTPPEVTLIQHPVVHELIDLITLWLEGGSTYHLHQIVTILSHHYEALAK